jgi:hypothetical protein
MTDKTKSKNMPELESIDSRLFNSFDPEEELWISGGREQGTQVSTGTTGQTLTVPFPDTDFDPDIDFDIDF